MEVIVNNWRIDALFLYNSICLITRNYITSQANSTFKAFILAGIIFAIINKKYDNSIGCMHGNTYKFVVSFNI